MSVVCPSPSRAPPTRLPPSRLLRGSGRAPCVAASVRPSRPSPALRRRRATSTPCPSTEPSSAAPLRPPHAASRALRCRPAIPTARAPCYCDGPPPSSNPAASSASGRRPAFRRASCGGRCSSPTPAWRRRGRFFCRGELSVASLPYPRSSEPALSSASLDIILVRAIRPRRRATSPPPHRFPFPVNLFCRGNPLQPSLATDIVAVDLLRSICRP